MIARPLSAQYAYEVISIEVISIHLLAIRLQIYSAIPDRCDPKGTTRLIIDSHETHVIIYHISLIDVASWRDKDVYAPWGGLA